MQYKIYYIGYIHILSLFYEHIILIVHIVYLLSENNNLDNLIFIPNIRNFHLNPNIIIFIGM